MKLFIEEVTNVWSKVEFDMITVLFGLSLLAVAMISNQAIGATMAKEANQFDKDRLIKSIKKGVLITIGLLAICFVTDLLPVLMERANILSENFSEGASVVITALQFVAIIVITIMKYVKEVYEKLLTLFEVKDDEVQKLVSQQNSNEFKEEVI